jgi:hypothetical protein
MWPGNCYYDREWYDGFYSGVIVGFVVFAVGVGKKYVYCNLTYICMVNYSSSIYTVAPLTDSAPLDRRGEDSSPYQTSLQSPP